MKLTLESAVSAFGAQTKAKLGNLAVKGQPEDQIRAPFGQLLDQLAQLCGFPQGAVVPVGESSVSDLEVWQRFAGKWATLGRSQCGYGVLPPGRTTV